MSYQVITEVSDLNIRNWKEFIAGHPQGSFFQSSEYYFFYQSLPYYEPIIIQILNKQNIVVGYLLAVIHKGSKKILNILSSRLIVIGGPVIQNHDDFDIILDLILKTLIDLTKKKSIYIEFRNFFDWKKHAKVFYANGFRFNDHLNFHIDTSSRFTTIKKFSKSKKRQIKKGLEAGARIIKPTNLKQVNEFYIILKKLYKCKVKKPLPEWLFFMNFFTKIVEENKGILLLINYQDKIIGGIMCPVFEKKTIYEWYVCGLDREYEKIYPSVLATWAAIDYATKNNFQMFDFFGAGSPNQNYGVREFKSKFGGELVNYGRFIRINNKYLYNLGKFGLKIKSKLFL